MEPPVILNYFKMSVGIYRQADNKNRPGDLPSLREVLWLFLQIFWLVDHPTDRAFPCLLQHSGLIRCSSSLTAAGPPRIFTGFPAGANKVAPVNIIDVQNAIHSHLLRVSIWPDTAKSL